MDERQALSALSGLEATRGTHKTERYLTVVLTIARRTYWSIGGAGNSLQTGGYRTGRCQMDVWSALIWLESWLTHFAIMAPSSLPQPRAIPFLPFHSPPPVPPTRARLTASLIRNPTASM